MFFPPLCNPLDSICPQNFFITRNFFLSKTHYRVLSPNEGRKCARNQSIYIKSLITWGRRPLNAIWRVRSGAGAREGRGSCLSCRRQTQSRRRRNFYFILYPVNFESQSKMLRIVSYRTFSIATNIFTQSLGAEARARRRVNRAKKAKTSSFRGFCVSLALPLRPQPFARSRSARRK